MSTPVENARKRLAALRLEAAEIERFIALYERFSSDPLAPAEANVSGTLGHSGETYPQNLSYVDSGDNSWQTPRRGPRPTEIAQMMERLIREVGRPMTRGEIVDAFDRRGMDIPAKDKARYLGTIAWRQKSIFTNVEGRGYWLRNVPIVGDRLEEFSDPPEETSEELPF